MCKAEARKRIDALNAKLVELYQAGRYADAKAVAKESLEVAERALGPEDPATAEGLSWLAVLLEAMGDRPAARPLYERALAIREKALGPAHPATATSLHNLALLFTRMGDLSAARPLMERALTVRENALGPDHPKTARILGDLAALLYTMGDFAGARPLMERALAIREKALGPDHLDIALGMNNLALLLYTMGDFAAARPLFERALAIREKVLGPNHPDTATSVNHLAGLLQTMGDLPAARPLQERALAIREKALGPDDPYTATSLNDLASLLEAMGDLALARPLYERALAIREKALGPDHPDTARSLNDLASLLQAMGDLPAARPLFERAVAIRQKALGLDHPDTATSLNNLARLLQAMGDLPMARSLYEHALTTNEKALGPDHPSTAISLNNLALLLFTMGDFAAARPLLERALAISEKALGPDHPRTAVGLNNLAVLLHDRGDLSAAGRLYERAWAAQRGMIVHLLAAFSSQERVVYMGSHSRALAGYLASSKGEAAKTYEAALAWKGAAHRATAANLRVPPDVPPEAHEAASELIDARRALAQLAVSPPTPKLGEPSVAKQYEDLDKRVRDLERALGKFLPDLATRAFQEITPAHVQETLPEGSALVDLLENEGILHAWVVPKTGEIAYFELGPAKDLAPLADAFRKALETNDKVAWEKSGASLRAKLEGPFAAALKDAKALYISPDGALATIPFGLLADGNGRFLMERCLVVHVTSGGGLVLASRTRPTTHAEGLLSLGGVDYEAATGGRGSGERVKHTVSPLPQSGKEAKDVATLFQARYPEAPVCVLSGKDATEGAFVREAPRARYVHAATHGFYDHATLRIVFAPEVEREHRGVSLSPAMSLAEVEMHAPGGARQSRRGGLNPLLFSGLVLAGANMRDGGASADGWLTAEELLGQDLTGTELVVLSACETGRGDLAAGEGVLGLTRSLTVAGAKNLVLSLWMVPDTDTRELMERFYEGLWRDDLSPEESLRRAQIERLSRDGDTFCPSAWGAWILVK